MKILIIDDELPALNLLKQTVLELIPDAEITALRHAGEFHELKDKSGFEIAFFDIMLGSTNGIRLALELKQAAPFCNIIFVTAFTEYAAQSFSARPSGYVVKPFTTDDIRLELENLRHPVSQPFAAKKLRIVTFGAFNVFTSEGEVFSFTRTRSKEILAYLIDQSGFPTTSRDIAADVLEEPSFDVRVSKRVSKLITLLIEDLTAAGYPDVVIKQNRQISINRDKVDCDLYRALEGDLSALNTFHGEYMLDYSWAEFNDIMQQMQ